MIGQTISHYRVVKKLGAGGMGVVYLAEDTRLNRFVALKFMPSELARDPSAIERFQREARAASALNHPHICTVHDVGEHAGQPFIVVEFLEGRTLAACVAGAPLPIEQLLDIAAQTADALEAAHAKGIVHRDIKPANIFVTDRRQVKLLDFGVAKLTEKAPGGEACGRTTMADLTSRGDVLGTAAYMSPEQVRGDEVDTRSDLFSLGAVLYEMATGRQAFAGATSGTIHEAILNRAPMPARRVNPELPGRLDEIINKALEKDRTLRYQNASDLRTDLQRLTRDTGAASGASDRGPSEAASTNARWVKTLAGVAGALALAALLALAARFVFFGAPGSAIESIAVLPFANATGDKDADYLSDGITESVINSLTQLPLLRVAARSTVFRYKGRDVDPQQIGRDLHVRAVLSGRLMRRGETMIVSTELLDVTDGSQLWGGQYNRAMSDVFALQDDLSLEISEKLRLRLTNQDKQRLAKRRTENAEAYQLYLKGLYEFNKLDPRALGNAAAYFQQAVDKDPSYALAYARLADTYNSMSFFNVMPPRDAMPRAKASAAKALGIDEQLAEAHISLGYASFTYDWDWAAATKHFDQAMALNPAAVMDHSYYPFFLTVGGRSAQAITVARRAFERDPVSARLSHTLAVQLVLAGQFDAAIQECRRTIELDPKFGVAYDVMGGTFAAKRMYREALAALERAVEISPDNSYSLAYLGYVRAALGDRSGARRILEQLTVASKERYISALAMAVVHVGLGDKDQAFGSLEQAYAERFNRLAYLRMEPVWDALRSDPRFDDLLRRIGLPLHPVEDSAALRPVPR